MSKALRYSMHCQGISQFYLHFIRKRNKLFLPLPSQPQLVLIYRPWRDGRLSRPWCEVAPAEMQPPDYKSSTTTQPLVHIAWHFWLLSVALLMMDRIVHYICCSCNICRDTYSKTVCNEKSAQRRRKHCVLAVVREQKISPCHRPLPRGTGQPKFNQLEMVTTFTYRPSLVKIDASNFELSW